MSEDCLILNIFVPQNASFGTHLTSFTTWLFLTRPEQGDPVRSFCLSLSGFMVVHSQVVTGPFMLVRLEVTQSFQGCSHDRSTLGNFLANTTNTLFVTINYRLGALGTFVNDKVGGTRSIGK